MQKEFANFNDMALVCIPVEILLTAKIPAHNEAGRNRYSGFRYDIRRNGTVRL